MAEATRTRPPLPPNQDPTNVYFIHPSYANTTQLVSVKFNGNGFNNRKRSMILTLSAKNKLCFVDGSHLIWIHLNLNPGNAVMILYAPGYCLT